MKWRSQLEQQQMISEPSPAPQIQSAPVPTPAPAVSATNEEVIQAQQDQAQQALMQKSVKKTTFAGDTGGFMPGQAGSPGVPGGNPSTYKRKLG
jgi:hypothetical protein